MGDPAAHAAGIVGDDAADLSRLDTCRIRADLAPMRTQRGVDPRANRARPAAHASAIRQHLDAPPMLTDDGQDSLTDRLARQRRTAGAKRDGLATRQECLDIRHGFGKGHRPGDEVVDAGIARPLQAVGEVGEEAHEFSSGGKMMNHAGR